MAFMTKGRLPSTTRTPAATRPPSCSCTARAVTTELVAAGSGVRRRVSLHHGRSARIRPVPRPVGRARPRRARDRRDRAARSSRNRARRARRPVDGRLGGGARPCARRSGSGRSPWPTSAISQSRDRRLRQRLAAASRRPAVPWHAASTRRSASESRASFLYAQISGLNAPLPPTSASSSGGSPRRSTATPPRGCRPCSSPATRMVSSGPSCPSAQHVQARASCCRGGGPLDVLRASPTSSTAR